MKLKKILGGFNMDEFKAKGIIPIILMIKTICDNEQMEDFLKNLLYAEMENKEDWKNYYKNQIEKHLNGWSAKNEN